VKQQAEAVVAGGVISPDPAVKLRIILVRPDYERMKHPLRKSVSSYLQILFGIHILL